MKSDNDNREPQLLDEQLDDALRMRAAEQSDMPWLETRVITEIESREQARRWLSENGSLFGSFNGRQTSDMLQQTTTEIGKLVVDATAVMRNSRLWVIFGALFGGGMVGWLIGIQLPVKISAGYPQLANLVKSMESTLPQLQEVAGLSIVLALVGAALATLAVEWQTVREYYS